MSDLLSLSTKQATVVCNAILPNDRANNLVEKWSNAYKTKNEEANSILVVSSIIAAGDQQPSATTSLSAAQGLIGKQAGRMVFLIGLAIEALENTDAITSTIQTLIAEGLKNTFEKISRELTEYKE